MDKSSSVKLSYNRLYQYIHLISNTTAATPVDIWQVSNKYIPPQFADNFSLGYYKNFKDEAYKGFWRKFDQTKNFPEMAGKQIRAYFDFKTVDSG